MSQTVAPGRLDLDVACRAKVELIARILLQSLRGMNRLLTRGKAYGQFGASDAENGKHGF